MENQFSRTQLLIGSDAVAKLGKSRVAVFGIGGVGSFTVEGLARGGVGTLDLIDSDTVSQSNINRQLIALHSTLGMKKTLVARNRVLDINPQIKVNTFDVFLTPDNSDMFDFSQYDYIVDAIDTVTAKIKLIECAKEANVPIISSMGTGNKLNPSCFEVADISKTSVCPLARVMRRELKKRGIENVKVVYSKEEPAEHRFDDENDALGGRTPASISFVPSVAGMIIAGEVIKDLIK